MPTTLSYAATIVVAFSTFQLDQAAALSTLSENFIRHVQSAPHPHTILPPRLCASPVPPIISLRVPVTSPGLQLSALDPNARQRPSIIKPDDNDPVCHRYHLRSQINLAELLPAQQQNKVINSTTGNLHKYRPLARGPKKALWTKGLANDLRPFSLSVGLRMPTGINTI